MRARKLLFVVGLIPALTAEDCAVTDPVEEVAQNRPPAYVGTYAGAVDESDLARGATLRNQSATLTLTYISSTGQVVGSLSTPSAAYAVRDCSDLGSGIDCTYINGGGRRHSLRATCGSTSCAVLGRIEVPQTSGAFVANIEARGTLNKR